MPATHIQDGSVARDISRGAVQLLRKYTGREPTEARTTIGKDTIAIILADPLTKGERSLVTAGRQQQVFQTRRKDQHLMRDDLVHLVEEESGCKVDAFFSDNHIDPDYAVEFFLLQPLPGSKNQAIAGEAEPPAW
jgi:uncharacterized protein YbcI